MKASQIVLISLVFLLALLPFTNPATGVETDYTIDGDKVYINISGKGMLTQEPHTLTDLTNKPIIDFTSYFPDTKELDFIFLFDTDKAKPTGAEYWTNYSHPNEEPVYGDVTYNKDCPGTYHLNYDYINDTWMWCNYTNINETEVYWEHYFTAYKANASGIRIFWNETEITGYIDNPLWYYDWKDISQKFSVKNIGDIPHPAELDNYTKAYYITNVSFNPNEKKTIRPNIQLKPTLGRLEGKYGIIIKLSAETLLEAKTSGHYVYLDPWFNANYDRKRNITSVPDVDLTLNVNGTSGFYGNRIFANPSNCNGDLSIYYKSTNTSDYAVVCNDTTEITLTTNSLTAYWKHDDATTSGSTSIDSIGENNGTITTATTGIEGQIYEAYGFDGNDYVSVLDDPSFDMTNLTLAVWVNLSSTAVNYYERVVLEKWGTGDLDRDYVIRVGNAHLNCLVNDGSTGTINYQGGAFSINEWTLLVITIEPTVMKGYINGSFDDSIVVSNVRINSTKPFVIGRYDEGVDRYFEGGIDEVGIWSRALSLLEVGTFYNNTKDDFNNMLVGAEESAPAVNTAPSITANATSPSTVYSNTDFKLNLTITDPEADTLTGYVQFYINGSSSGAEQSQEVTNNSNTLIGTLGNGNFSATYTLIAEYWAGDGTVNTTLKYNATEVTVSSFVMGGTVKDSSNIVVNNAKVIIINQATNTITGTTDSNSTGGWTYNIGSTGTYLVVAYDPNNSTRDGDADPHIIVS